VVALLSKAGDHVPVIPLFDAVGKAESVSPWQIGATCVKLGTMELFTVMVIVAVAAHCPAFGVKVYVVVAKLFKAGDHVPVIPLFDAVGKAERVSPWHIEATCVKVGTILAVVTFNCAALLTIE